MRRAALSCTLVAALAVAVCDACFAGSGGHQFWILPFDNAAADRSRAHLMRAIPELLTVLVSRAGEHAVVERDDLDRILAEHALSREGFVAPARRGRIGRLLGATAMISGSFAREGKALVVTARITEVTSGRVLASAHATGGDERLAETLQALYRDLARELRGPAPEPNESPVDRDPAGGLHFLRGLSAYHAARYSRALAEFIQCRGDTERDGWAGLWRANCYLARGEYDHACLELTRLQKSGRTLPVAADVEDRLRRCRAELSPQQARTCELLSGAAKSRTNAGD